MEKTGQDTDAGSLRRSSKKPSSVPGGLHSVRLACTRNQELSACPRL